MAMPQLVLFQQHNVCFIAHIWQIRFFFPDMQHCRRLKILYALSYPDNRDAYIVCNFCIRQIGKKDSYGQIVFDCCQGKGII